MKKHFLCSLLLLFFCLIIVPIAHSMAFAGNVKSEQRIKARKNPYYTDPLFPEAAISSNDEGA